ncbi:acyl-CoA thioesterase [Leptolyngbya sp. AN02str]|uniref:acyl-CoA thioesterase n=1 Tax=Leptolyngbya sp. AN02str TaxID=3423363 RepID=UPI003D30FAAB
MQTPLPTSTLQQVTPESSNPWFEYAVHAHPHHTDYAGIVWHGSYVSWMEETRVEYLRSLGISFADLVALGCDLPVVELSIRYRRSLRMGESALIKARMNHMDGVRIIWDYRIEQADTQELCVTAQVTLVAIDRDKGKIMRQLPPTIKDALTRLSS